MEVINGFVMDKGAMDTGMDQWTDGEVIEEGSDVWICRQMAGKDR